MSCWRMRWRWGYEGAGGGEEAAEEQACDDYIMAREGQVLGNTRGCVKDATRPFSPLLVGEKAPIRVGFDHQTILAGPVGRGGKV